jgi:hypothetical protein
MALQHGLVLPLEVWDNDGVLIALSNRRLAAYSIAGIVYPPDINTRQPTMEEKKRLSQASCLDGGPLPSLSIAVTTEMAPRCGETLAVITSIVRKRD